MEVEALLNLIIDCFFDNAYVVQFVREECSGLELLELYFGKVPSPFNQGQRANKAWLSQGLRSSI